MKPAPEWLLLANGWVATLTIPLIFWILVSGLDDLFLNYVWFLSRYRRKQREPSAEELEELPERRIAVFVPLWQEHNVIEAMVVHNRAAIRYRNYHFFLGAYPNDEPTLQALRQLESRYPNVHIALCPHDGPTSKADCLNWIYQQMLLFEEAEEIRFDLAITHDAEDLIHPEAFRWTNYYASAYDMIQIPVLPLPTRARELTHGVYCDEFAESQTRDLQMRLLLGGFLPSSGVGTGFTRRCLERLAQSESNRIFEPACLTEDYENGFRIRHLGMRQMFAPIRMRSGGPVATQEYFPRSLRAAIKQRTRWVTGIALQGWEWHGWQGGLRQAYWHWRDRKGLIGSPLSLLANSITLYGAVTLAWCNWAGVRWRFLETALPETARLMLPLTLSLMVMQGAARVLCVQRYYGWRFALGALLRLPWGNIINSVATVRALCRYGMARARGRRLAWLKTEHCYPNRQVLEVHKQTLSEILTGSGYIAQTELDAAVRSKPAGVPLADHLLAIGLIGDQELCEALSLQQGVPMTYLDPAAIPRRLARSLPAHVIHKWQVLPYRIAAGNLYVAGPQVPGEALHEALHKHTRHQVRFELITKSNFEQLCQALL